MQEIGPYLFDHGGAFGGTTNAVVGPRLCLPDSECETCGRRTMHSCIVLPNVRTPAEVSSGILSYYSPRGRSRFVCVSRLEFKQLAAKFADSNPSVPHFVPGAWLGPITLRVRGKLRDVVWSGMTPFFSQRVVQAAETAGVRIHPEPVRVFKSRGEIAHYFSCQPALTELWAAEALLRFYDRCPVCGMIWLKEAGTAVEANYSRAYIRSQWPNREGIVYSTEHADYLFSELFVEVCAQAEFEGLSFKRVGYWLNR